MGHFIKLVSLAAATLLLCNTLTFAQAPPSQSDEPETADHKEFRTFKLTAARLDKYEMACKAMFQVLHEHPELKKKMDDDAAKSADNPDQQEHQIDGSVKSVEAQPELSAAVKDSGLTVREYVVMTYTLMNSMMLVGLKKQGVIPEYPPSISKENATFVEQHYERVTEIMAPFMRGEANTPQSDSKEQNNDPKKDHQN